MKKALIFDIDNCLSNDVWRRDMLSEHFHEQGLGPVLARWHAYHSMSPFDEPGFLPMFEVALRSIQPSLIFYFTARPALYRHQTSEWLERNVPWFVASQSILMRGNSDARPSEEIKRGMLSEICREYDLAASEIAAFDDSSAVLRMYREEGVEAFYTSIEHAKFEWRW